MATLNCYPALPAWQSALYLEDIRDLALDSFVGRGAPNRDAPAVVLSNVAEATVREARALQGTTVFLFIAYYTTQRARGTYHSPQNCLPGAGWEIIQRGRMNVPDNAAATINDFTIAKENTRRRKIENQKP